MTSSEANNYRFETVKVGKGEPQYETIVAMDRSDQIQEIPYELVMNTCFPCCKKASRQTFCIFCWAFLESELFRMVLEILAIIFGVIKEALDWREHRPEAHYASSIFETAVTCLVVCIDCGSQWHIFIQHKRHDKAFATNTYATERIMRYLLVHTIFSAFLVCFSSMSAIMLSQFSHMGWTIFSNQLTILLTESANSLLRECIDDHFYRLTIDHMKVLLIEAVDILQAVSKKKDCGVDNQRITTFINTATDESKLPEYFFLSNSLSCSSPKPTFKISEV